MKNFHQNLLILLALSLCGLCVYQWYGQTSQRLQVAALNQMVYEKAAAIQGYTNSIATMDRQIAQMDATITGLKESARSNELALQAHKRDLSRLELTNEALTNQITEYKKAVETLESKVKEAYEGINKQNAAINDLAAQRDEFVKKFNDSVKDRNDIVTKYNDLVSQAAKQQAGNSKGQ